MKRRLFSASLFVRFWASEHLLSRKGQVAFRLFQLARIVANALEDLSRGKRPGISLED